MLVGVTLPVTQESTQRAQRSAVKFKQRLEITNQVLFGDLFARLESGTPLDVDQPADRSAEENRFGGVEQTCASAGLDGNAEGCEKASINAG